MPVLSAAAHQLNLTAVLLNGQSFRWILVDGWYYGTAIGRLWKCRRLSEKEVEYSVLARSSNSPSTSTDSQVLQDYLNMKVDLEALYTEWSKADHRIKDLLERDDSLKGIRILSQEPLETLLAFICSANNNIKRISKMVNYLCQQYGSRLSLIEEVSVVDQKVVGQNGHLLHALPTVQQLSTGIQTMEKQLRDAGFGYRAGYIASTVKLLQNLDYDYLTSLKSLELEIAKEKLMEFSGVGPKVADCICLMGLGLNSVVPVDTHVLKATIRDYRRDLSKKSLTPAIHKEIGTFYAEKFGPFAGWTQALLFNAQLAEKRKNQPFDENKKAGKVKKIKVTV